LVCTGISISMVWIGIGIFISIGIGIGIVIHWQWYALPFHCLVWYGMHFDFLVLVWYALPFPCMVWIGNGMVWYGMVCIGNGNGTVCIVNRNCMHWKQQWYAL
jgi:hypothetical protein